MEASRYVIIGNTCAGKSTLAAELASRLSLELIDLDALYWKPNWQQRATEEFRTQVSQATQGSNWVVAGNYSHQRDISWVRAQVVVWLDAALPVIVWRILKRSWERHRSQELLWGTNRERFGSVLKLWNQNESLLAWAVRQHARQRQGYAALMRDPQWRHLEFVRLSNNDEIRVWMAKETRAAYLSLDRRTWAEQSSPRRAATRLRSVRKRVTLKIYRE